MRRIRAFPTALLVVFAASLLATASAHAAPGDLDPTFSGDGLQTTDFDGGGGGADVAVQADGKIVVVGSAGGDFAVGRYNRDGSLDPTFSGDGKQTTDLGGACSERQTDRAQRRGGPNRGSASRWPATGHPERTPHRKLPLAHPSRRCRA